MGGKFLAPTLATVTVSILFLCTNAVNINEVIQVSWYSEHPFLRLLFFAALTFVFVAASVLIYENTGKSKYRIPMTNFKPLVKQMSVTEYETTCANKTRSEMHLFRSSAEAKQGAKRNSTSVNTILAKLGVNEES
jgi:hypothetical protein